MLYMVIERFRPGRVDDVYARLSRQGRMLPDGLEYLDSWVSTDRTCCYQLMRCRDGKLLDEWTARWRDLVDFEIVPVMSSADAVAGLSGKSNEDT